MELPGDCITLERVRRLLSKVGGVQQARLISTRVARGEKAPHRYAVVVFESEELAVKACELHPTDSMQLRIGSNSGIKAEETLSSPAILSRLSNSPLAPRHGFF